MSSEFLRKYAKGSQCPGCKRWFTVKGIKQHERRCEKRQAMYKRKATQ